MPQDLVKFPIYFKKHLSNGLGAETRWTDRHDLHMAHSSILGKGHQILEHLVQMEGRFFENVLSIDA
jgi:hypothetical protein